MLQHMTYMECSEAKIVPILPGSLFSPQPQTNYLISMKPPIISPLVPKTFISLSPEVLAL